MAVMKRSVSLDVDLWHRVVSEVEDSQESVSGLISEALDLLLTRRTGLAAVAAWEAEHGALTPAELDAAEAELNAAGALAQPR